MIFLIVVLAATALAAPNPQANAELQQRGCVGRKDEGCKGRRPGCCHVNAESLWLRTGCEISQYFPNGICRPVACAPVGGFCDIDGDCCAVGQEFYIDCVNDKCEKSERPFDFGFLEDD
ncbi:hypothetical protein GGI35DRAFT_489107 [Trichoderma velutinum]